MPRLLLAILIATVGTDPPFVSADDHLGNTVKWEEDQLKLRNEVYDEGKLDVIFEDLIEVEALLEAKNANVNATTNQSSSVNLKLRDTGTELEIYSRAGGGGRPTGGGGRPRASSRAKSVGAVDECQAQKFGVFALGLLAAGFGMVSLGWAPAFTGLLTSSGLVWGLIDCGGESSDDFLIRQQFEHLYALMAASIYQTRQDRMEAIDLIKDQFDDFHESLQEDLDKGFLSPDVTIETLEQYSKDASEKYMYAMRESEATIEIVLAYLATKIALEEFIMKKECSASVGTESERTAKARSAAKRLNRFLNKYVYNEYKSLSLEHQKTKHQEHYTSQAFMDSVKCESRYISNERATRENNWRGFKTDQIIRKRDCEVWCSSDHLDPSIAFSRTTVFNCCKGSFDWRNDLACDGPHTKNMTEAETMGKIALKGNIRARFTEWYDRFALTTAYQRLLRKFDFTTVTCADMNEDIGNSNNQMNLSDGTEFSCINSPRWTCATQTTQDTCNTGDPSSWHSICCTWDRDISSCRSKVFETFVTWEKIESQHYWKSVSMSNNGEHIWAVDDEGRVYTRTKFEKAWTEKTDGILLAQISVSADGNHILGVRKPDQSSCELYWRPKNGSWMLIPPPNPPEEPRLFETRNICYVSVNFDGSVVWGISEFNHVYRLRLRGIPAWTEPEKNYRASLIFPYGKYGIYGLSHDLDVYEPEEEELITRAAAYFSSSTRGNIFLKLDLFGNVLFKFRRRWRIAGNLPNFDEIHVSADGNELLAITQDTQDLYKARLATTRFGFQDKDEETNTCVGIGGSGTNIVSVECHYQEIAQFAFSNGKLKVDNKCVEISFYEIDEGRRLNSNLKSEENNQSNLRHKFRGSKLNKKSVRKHRYRRLGPMGQGGWIPCSDLERRLGDLCQCDRQCASKICSKSKGETQKRCSFSRDASNEFHGVCSRDENKSSTASCTTGCNRQCASHQCQNSKCVCNNLSECNTVSIKSCSNVDVQNHFDFKDGKITAGSKCLKFESGVMVLSECEDSNIFIPIPF